MKRSLASLSAVTFLVAISTGNAFAAGDPVKGKQVFAQCQACHRIDASGKSTIGPNLYKLFGRKSGSLADFRFSPAMTKAARPWNDATLDAFLAAPSQNFPGNRMPFGGLKQPADRQNVIAYIRSASQ
ncbi:MULTISPECIES: c-type cytochrome [Sphingobium]|uniref:Cytochrome c domain-containing protein n=1 Tax=Sphingobium chungbukense TaxID=56193 RepID=A0A0M3ASS6_9SPHN|nr:MULTISPECIES: cytochrome c family protein [Sphingobium]KKW91996.1 hypothetical protein YP76_13025 [Sphingobium chungbukense]PJG46196.1 cytochrome c family protein [Sphingobium sp. LB126]